MSISCEKEFTITVSPPDFYAYWKCEEDAYPILDSTGLADFTVYSLAINRVAGKINYGYALTFTAVTDPLAGSPFAFADSFTIRFWYYEDGSLSSLQLFDNDPDGGDESFSIYANAGPGNNGVWFELWDSTNTSHEINASSGVELPVGWHRVMFWYDADADQIGAKIDDEASVTLAQPDGIYATPGGRLILNHGFAAPACKIDEIAIWDRVLTAAEMTTDWNSGNGTTYPTI